MLNSRSELSSRAKLSEIPSLNPAQAHITHKT